MNFPPYQWRADGGYLPNPTQPPPTCTSYPTFTSPRLQPGYAHHLFYPSHGVVAAIPPPPPVQPKKVVEKKKEPVLPPAKPASTVAPSCTTSKTLVTADCKCTTKFSCKGAETSCVCKYTATLPERKKKAEEPEKKAAPSTVTHEVSNMSPPTLRPGENYMFADLEKHTMLHVFNKAAPIWEDKYKGTGLAFKMFKVATTFSVGNVIERVLKKKPGAEEGWILTECYEVGEGEWKKGSSIAYGSEKCKGTLESMGWGGKRGDGLPPVWLAVHKA